jgi:hypothetical protein
MNTVRLFCGHVISETPHAQMFQIRIIRCPVCGTEWRGTMVIARDKSLAKKELRWALDRANESKRRKNQK